MPRHEGEPIHGLDSSQGNVAQDKSKEYSEDVKRSAGSERKAQMYDLSHFPAGEVRGSTQDLSRAVFIAPTDVSPSEEEVGPY